MQVNHHSTAYDLDLPMLNGLSLFSGIGGIDIALQKYVRPIAYCEIDPYCQAVLLNRQVSGDLCAAPIWDDIKTLTGSEFDCKIDIIAAGFPCQDISSAGLRKGLEGQQSRLFFEIVRLAKEIKPKFIFLENVPAIRSRGALRVVSDIAHLGYDCRWCVISAASVGAVHRRERWFLLAHTDRNGSSACQGGGSSGECTAQRKESQEQKESIGQTQRASCLSSDVANTTSLAQRRLPMRTEKKQPKSNHPIEHPLWSKEPQDKLEMAGVANGLRDRTHRIKALGNAVVPVQVKEAFEILMGLK